MNKEDPRLIVLRLELAEKEFEEVVEALNKVEEEQKEIEFKKWCRENNLVPMKWEN